MNIVADAQYEERQEQWFADKRKERRVKGNLDGTDILESKNLSKNLCIAKTGEWSVFYCIYYYYGLQSTWGKSVVYDVYIKFNIT